MKTIPGLEWDGELTAEHFRIFCNREESLKEHIAIRKKTIEALITEHRLLDYKIGEMREFKELFGNKSIDGIPHELWKQLKFKNDKYQTGLRLEGSGKQVNDMIDNYLNSEAGIKEMDKIFKGYALKQVFDQGETRERVFDHLKQSIVELKDDVEEKSQKQRIGERLVDMVAQEFYEYLNEEWSSISTL